MRNYTNIISGGSIIYTLEVTVFYLAESCLNVSVYSYNGISRLDQHMCVNGPTSRVLTTAVSKMVKVD
ncbi:hypothetical protein DPMN_191678 [Dreissena polymorpha]|uniref:Uncharacterized protein n=1 Tax=Dreissena polymorpha TaxID=45954 RepID=A0A9D3Y1X3_DREPO|nr:hypothetical protein DPMN_191678 [Dreissena polymorpha]